MEEKEQTTIRLPIELKKLIQTEADKRGHSFNGMVLLLLSKGMAIISQGLL